MNNMSISDNNLLSVYRLTPSIGDGKYYSHAEATVKKEMGPNREYFAPKESIVKVGKLIRIEEGGFGDGRWQRDIFETLHGQITTVEYSYWGNTCFREAPDLRDLAKAALSEMQYLKNANTLITRSKIVKVEVLNNVDLLAHILSYF